MQIEGFEQTGTASDELECVGALDRDAHRLRKGQQVWWRQTNVEYDEWEPYCRTCAKAYAEQTY